MDIINGYQIIKNFSAEDAGFCKWGFAEKGGYEYFIKEFLAPKYPLESHGLDPAAMEKKKKQCESFFAEKKKLYQAIASCRTGNVIAVEDFFRNGAKYYAVTQKVTATKLSLKQISELEQEKKYTLIRSLTYSIARLHSKSVIHADIKPENILIKKTEAGFYTGKIIDFDSGFLESSVPEEIQGDQVYLAPEVRLHMMGEKVSITTKLDIFALGILFHQYWTGEMPSMLPDYDYVFESVLDDSPAFLDGSIPPVLRYIIEKMLEKDPASRPSAVDILRALDTTIPGRTSFPENVRTREKGFRQLGDL